MKKHRVKKSVLILAMMAAAVCLLTYSTVGGARAVLTYYSETYTTQFEMFDIGITLRENGEPVHLRNYDKEKRDFVSDGDQQLLKSIDKFEFGQKYDEKLTVMNTGTIDEYVILTVRKYWVGPSDNGTKAPGGSYIKRTDLDPSLIQLHFTPGEHWIIDTANTDDKTERTVMIYDIPLKSGEETEPATDWITVDSAVKAVVEEVTETTINGVRTIVTTYSYNGLKFVIEAEAEGVQTHNGEDAIRSAWGREVTIDPNTKKITAIKN